MWQRINGVISTGRNRGNDSFAIKVDGRRIPDENVANAFVEHFASAASSIAKHIPDVEGDSPDMLHTLKRIERTIFLHPTTPEEIANMIAALKTRKASGYDGINTRILKSCSSSISPVISDIINSCFLSGQYPEGLKIARVIPVYKSGNRNELDNYRPISVLPVLNDVFERAITNRLCNFLNRRKFFNGLQFGFRKKCGTITALTEVVNGIQCELNDRKVSTGLFTDLTKASDTVNHDILLHKLELAGIRGVSLQLFSSYLSGRKLVVDANDVKSGRKDMNIDITQGSICGPLMFLIYINDIFELKLHGQLYLFADDSASFYHSAKINENIVKMCEDIAIITIYLRINRRR